MSDIDELVQRAIDGVTTISGRAARFAGKLLVVTAVVCVGGFLLGLAALSGGIETVWIVLGVVFGALAIGGALVAWWRVASIRRHVPELASEVRELLDHGESAGRTVIETFIVDDEQRGSSAIVLSRGVGDVRGAVGSGLESSARLSAVVTALTSFPGLVLAAILIGVVFAFLGFLFLVALAL